MTTPTQDTTPDPKRTTDPHASEGSHSSPIEVPQFVRGEPGFTEKLNQLGDAVRQVQQAQDEKAAAPAGDVTIESATVEVDLEPILKRLEALEKHDVDTKEPTGAAKSAATRKRRDEIETIVKEILAGDTNTRPGAGAAVEPAAVDPGKLAADDAAAPAVG